MIKTNVNASSMWEKCRFYIKMMKSAQRLGGGWTSVFSKKLMCLSENLMSINILKGDLKGMQ